MIEVRGVQGFDSDRAADDAEKGQQSQRPEHDGWRFMGVNGGVGFVLTKKDDEDQTKHVKGSQGCDQDAEREKAIAKNMVWMLDCAGQDTVLAEKST